MIKFVSKVLPLLFSSMGASWESLDLVYNIDLLTDRELKILYAMAKLKEIYVAAKSHPAENAALISVVTELKKRNMWSEDEGGIF